MPQPQRLAAQFTLLYGDPASSYERAYLQPLYGLTLPPQPPAPVVRSARAVGTGDAEHVKASSGNTANATIASPTTATPTTATATPAATQHRRRQLDLANTGLFPELSAEGMGPQPVLGGCFLGPESDNSNNNTCTDASLFHPDGTPFLRTVMRGVRGESTTSTPQARNSDDDNAAIKNKSIKMPQPQPQPPTPPSQLSRVRSPYPCPSARSGHVLLSSRDLGRLVLHGGLEDSCSNDTWLFDSTTHRWTELKCTAAAATKATTATTAAADPSTQPPPVSGFPPCSFGAAGALYHCYDDKDKDDDGGGGGRVTESVDSSSHEKGNSTAKRSSSSKRRRQRKAAALRMLVMGGMQDDDDCNPHPYSLNLATREWSWLDLSLALPAMWGSVAETVRVRRRHRSHGRWTTGCGGSGGGEDGSNIINRNINNSDEEDEEEEVVVLFGGMDNQGVPISETRLLHLERRLTSREAFADPEYFLQQCGYDEGDRIRRHLEERREQSDRDEAMTRRLEADEGREEATTVTSGGGGDSNNSISSAMYNLSGLTANNDNTTGGGGGGSMPAATTAAVSAAFSALFGTRVATDNTIVTGGGDGMPALFTAYGDGDNNNEMGGGPSSPAAKPTVTLAEIAAFRQSNRDALDDWRVEALQTRVVGKYLVETLPPTPGLLGRRRASSCLHRGKYVFVFGGRDDFGYYNDFWCMNADTRRWVQIRDEVPLYWISRFFQEPHDEVAAAAIQAINAQVRAIRSDPVRNEVHNPSNASRYRSDISRRKYVHESLYSSKLNSTAKARTGSVMMMDERQRCLVVFGGFALTGGKMWTFTDVHAYHLDWHCWRRVMLLPRRHFDVRLVEDRESCCDADGAAVGRGFYDTNNGNDNGKSSIVNMGVHRVSGGRATAAAAACFRPIVRRVSAVLDATLTDTVGNRRLLKNSLRCEPAASDDDIDIDIDIDNNGSNERSSRRRVAAVSADGYGHGPAATDNSDVAAASGGGPRTPRPTAAQSTAAIAAAAVVVGDLSPATAAATTHRLRIRDVAPVPCRYEPDAQLIAGMTAMQYAHRYLSGQHHHGTRNSNGNTIRQLPPSTVAVRHSRLSLLASPATAHTNSNSGSDDNSLEHYDGAVALCAFDDSTITNTDGNGNSRHRRNTNASAAATERALFQLPVMIPEARTMAAAAADPFNYPHSDDNDDEDDDVMAGEQQQQHQPQQQRRRVAAVTVGGGGGGGARFFVHGGRKSDEARGDLFELRLLPFSQLDHQYQQTVSALDAWVIEREMGNTRDAGQATMVVAASGGGANPGATISSTTTTAEASTNTARAPAPAPQRSPDSPSSSALHSLISEVIGNRLPHEDDRNASLAELAAVHAKCAAVSRARVLREAALLDASTDPTTTTSSITMSSTRNPSHRGNPFVPHGNTTNGDGVGDGSRAAGTVYFAATRFLKSLVDIAVRDRGEAATSRDCHTNFPIIDPSSWVAEAAAAGTPTANTTAAAAVSSSSSSVAVTAAAHTAAVSHSRLVHAAAQLTRTLGDTLLTRPPQRMEEEAEGVEEVTRAVATMPPPPPPSVAQWSALPRFTPAAATTVAAHRRRPSGNEPTATTTAPSTSPSNTIPITTTAATRSVVVEKHTPSQQHHHHHHQHQLLLLPARTRSLANGHLALYQLLREERFYFSGYERDTDATEPPHAILMDALNSISNTTASTVSLPPGGGGGVVAANRGCIDIEVNPQLARGSLARRLPVNFLSRLELH